MIIIHSQNDIAKIENKELQEYIEHSFSRMPTDLVENYEENGSYFVVIDSFDELTQKSIKIDECEIASIANEEFFNNIELVEARGDILEVLIQFSTDISFALVMKIQIVPHHILDRFSYCSKPQIASANFKVRKISNKHLK